MHELKFDAPDAEIWEQDATHFPAPLSLFAQEAFSTGFIRGFKSGTARYGLLLDHLKPSFVNGFLYVKPVIVGLENAPEVRSRLSKASTVLRDKPWRDDLDQWDRVVRPKSTNNHLRLQAVDIAALSNTQLAEHITECFENLKDMTFQHHVFSLSCCIPVGDFIACVQEWTGLSPSAIAQALRGSTPISAGITDEYLAAVKAVRSDQSAATILAGTGDPGEMLDQLRRRPDETGQAVRSYLDLVSHRILGGYDIISPSAIETPEVLVMALRSAYSAEGQAKAEQEVTAQHEKIRSAVPEQHRPLFDELLTEARLANRLRDERSYWSELWAAGISRRAILEAGRRVASKGLIKTAGHLLEASSREIEILLTKKKFPAAPRPEELERRHQFRHFATKHTAPRYLNGDPSPTPPLEAYPEEARRTMRALGVFMSLVSGESDLRSEGRTVRGIAVSTGCYEGRSRVIESLEDLPKLQKGDVLVTRSTSAAFNSLLPLVGAIVTDRGGLMSHAAIVAREYALPGVVGCQVATRTIRDGAWVRVDADKGEVTIL